MELKWYCKQQKNTENWDAWCAELNAENNVEIWSIDALESSKRYKMCKAIIVKHISKKIIGVYTMHYDWSALEIVISIDALVSILSDNVMTDF